MTQMETELVGMTFWVSPPRAPGPDPHLQSVPQQHATGHRELSALHPLPLGL